MCIGKVMLGREKQCKQVHKDTMPSTTTCQEEINRGTSWGLLWHSSNTLASHLRSEFEARPDLIWEN